MLLQALPQLQLGPVNDDPVVGRRDGELLTDFFAGNFFHELQAEHGLVLGGQLVLAAQQLLGQLALLQLGIGGGLLPGFLTLSPVHTSPSLKIGAVAHLIGRAGQRYQQ